MDARADGREDFDCLLGRVRFRRQSRDPVHCQQDISFDGGSTWRSTWTMTFARAR